MAIELTDPAERDAILESEPAVMQAFQALAVVGAELGLAVGRFEQAATGKSAAMLHEVALVYADAYRVAEQERRARPTAERA